MTITTKEQIETPALLLDLDILEQNIKNMAEFMSGKTAELRPHYKSYKCPTISHKQVEAGAKGICCAKLSEAKTLVNAGIDDVLIANQIVDPKKIARLAGLANGSSKLTVAVDNSDNIKSLSNATLEFGSELYVLVEVNVGMERCGVNTPKEVFELAKAVETSKSLVFEGIQAYEGHLVYTTEEPHYTEQYKREGVQEMIEKISNIKSFLEKKGIQINEISGGGTGTYYLTGDDTPWTEIQAGSYVLMDNVYNQYNLSFDNSLTILTQIMHKRPGIAIADAGLKVCTTEQGLPTIKNYPQLEFRGTLSEEHGIIVDKEDKLEYLQKIEYTPSHCCTTVNLHDQYWCVRNGLLESVWPITGRGASK